MMGLQVATIEHEAVNPLNQQGPTSMGFRIP
jgi:hypothetical protein